MEELSKQFVDTVRNHLDSVGIPITNVEHTKHLYLKITVTNLSAAVKSKLTANRS